MTAVCSVGLDMIAIPGKTTAATISGMIADEAAIGIVNNKTTAVRVIPVPGKDVGESIEFGGLFGRAPIMAVNDGDPSVFINRGGQIPARFTASRTEAKKNQRSPRFRGPRWFWLGRLQVRPSHHRGKSG